MKFKHMRWEEICKRLPKDRDIIGAEIGVWTGKTSNYLLEHLPNLKMFMVDIWGDPSDNPSFLTSGAKMARYGKEVYDQAYNTVAGIQKKYADRSHQIKAFSVDAAKMFEDEYFDFILQDDDHSLEGVRNGIKNWLPKLKYGGLYIWHDYKIPDKKNRGFWGVRQAVLENFPEEEIELGDDHTAFYRKK
jgi:hypothetical protein